MAVEEIGVLTSCGGHMARRLVTPTEGHFYHVYNRGNDRNRVFFERENYRFFLSRVRRRFESAAVELICYSLLPNHYHLLVHLGKQIDFANVMRSISVSFTKAMNKRYGRTGHLFQGDYAADQVKDDAHLMNLIQYIHSNPVNAGLVTKPGDWEFSDYREWVDDEMEGIQRILLRGSFFRNGVGYEKSITEYMTRQRRVGNL